MSLSSTALPGEVRRIERLCDRFESAWKAGQRPRLQAYIGHAREPLRGTLLRHLVALDWEYRLRSGEQPRAVDYLAMFPADGVLIEAIGREMAPMHGTDGSLPHRLGKYRIV